MKKIFGLLFLVLLVNSCDDGDATVQTVTFDDTDAKTCGELIYRITENRVMILKLNDATDGLFVNDPTAEGVIRTASIPAMATVTYREYDGTLTGSTLCDSPPPLTPIATLEWQAAEGTVEVTTTAILSTPNTETGATTISKYRHRIVFRNLKLVKPDGTTQNYPEYVFGNYDTPVTNTLPFQFEALDVEVCPATNTIYNAQNSGAEGLYIQNYSATMLDTSNLGTPRSFAIGLDENAVIYKLLASSIPAGGNADYFCTGSTTPIPLEQWQAVEGTIEVTTSQTADYFEHEIRLKNVYFQKGNSRFYYGDNILYGTLRILL